MKLCELDLDILPATCFIFHVAFIELHIIT